MATVLVLSPGGGGWKEDALSCAYRCLLSTLPPPSSLMPSALQLNLQPCSTSFQLCAYIPLNAHAFFTNFVPFETIRVSFADWAHARSAHGPETLYVELRTGTPQRIRSATPQPWRPDQGIG